MPTDIFGSINNAVLDLQASQFQTYERPLRQLGKLLRDPALAEVNQRLLDQAKLDQFLAAAEQTSGSMVGTDRLPWPDDPDEALGISLGIILKLADDSNFVLQFSYKFFNSGNKAIASVHSLVRQLIIPFVRDYKAYVMSQGETAPQVVLPKSNKVFIVHGHDGEARETVARFIGDIGLEPIILNEQPNLGRTVIEKVEAHSEVGFAVVLLTPDDLGRAKASTELEPRARQNVLLELGYFIGKLKRSNVCALKRGEVMVPSDFAGVVWENMDSNGGWKLALARELRAVGYQFDWSRIAKG